MSPNHVRAGLWAVVPAAGRGTRFGAEVPKQYMEAGGRPLIAWTLHALLMHASVAGVMVVLAEDDAHWPGWDEIAGKPVMTSIGGAERAGCASSQALDDVFSVFLTIALVALIRIDRRMSHPTHFPTNSLKASIARESPRSPAIPFLPRRRRRRFAICRRSSQINSKNCCTHKDAAVAGRAIGPCLAALPRLQQDGETTFCERSRAVGQ